VQNFGGYHAPAVDVDTHVMFEEVPSLGIAGDMVMALASEEAEPVPNFHVGRPVATNWTNNLVSKILSHWSEKTRDKTEVGRILNYSEFVHRVCSRYKV